MSLTVNTTTAIATITAPAATAIPVVKISRTTLVVSLFAEARRLILDDVPTARVPRITAAGVEEAYRLATSREPLNDLFVMAYLMAADVRKLPPAVRRRKVVSGLAGWLVNVTGRVPDRELEGWFGVRTMRAVAEATNYVSTPEEAAGVYALLMVRRAC